MRFFSKETKENVAFEIGEFIEDWQLYVIYLFAIIVGVLIFSFSMFSTLAALGVIIPFWVVILASVLVIPVLSALFIFVWDSLPCCEL